ncbi:MAG: glucose PTS transporter subunit IIA [Lachnospiraceae bacterium]|nr:glucose PTS transporter subunit IIA [Lachnospiraceae bacterium]
MDYRACAQSIYEAIGGKGNIVSAAHCATRLRLVIADNTKCSKEQVEAIDGVKGVFEAAGQLQIILGTGTVNKVFDEFVQIAGISAGTKEDVKQAASAKQNIFKRAIKTLGDIFVPIIPAIVASGLLMGLLEGLSNVWPDMANSGTYEIIHLFSNAAFVFLPILIAISTAKVFGGNIFLGAVIGMIMIHTDLMNAWSVASAESVPTASAWFGLYDINLVGYQGHVIPVVIAVALMCFIEKKLHKIVPEMLDLFITPFVSVLVTGYLTLTIIGPIFSVIENYVLMGAQYLITIPFGIGAFFMGAAYAPTVVAGVHHMYNAIEAGLISSTGLNTWMPIATAANVAQAGAALAVALKTKNKKVKSMALPASLSGFLGITEPAIFGVNIRFFKAFVAGCIGGAVGALFGSIMHIGATAYGVTGVFGFLITTQYALPYLIMMLISTGVAFALSWIMFKDENDATKDVKTGLGEETTAETVVVENVEKASETIMGSPLEGKAIKMSQVNDATFAAEVLGQGMAVVPTVGKVVAPCDGVVSATFDTKHAVGLTADSGEEILIHVGINTVELNGEHYIYHVTDDQKVKKGDLLLEFDIPAIQAAGYDVTTPFIITNSDDYAAVTMKAAKDVVLGEDVLTISK